MGFFYNLVFEGEKVPALDTMPILYEDLAWIWDAFCTLNRCRSSGMNGPHPIQFIEMQAMANELEINGETRTRFFDRISILDRVYLDYCQKKAESLEPKPKKRKK